MNILLLGSTGFVGKHLKKRLEELGHVVARGTRGNPLASVQANNLPDAIINCAGEVRDAEVMYESNVELVNSLLEFAVAFDIKKFIHVGSSSEYGPTNAPRREDMACHPSNVYEATKLAGTHLCQGFAHQYDMDVVVARPFSLYGPQDADRKLVSRLYKSYVSHERIELFEGSHDWLFIDDFLDGIIALLNAPRELTKGDIVNFGSGFCSTNDEVVTAMERALGGSLNIVRQPGKFHDYDVQNWVADITKANVKYGWKPKWALNSGITEFVTREWFAVDKG
jgi:nucleoside-diphosphate-sugar epimerase